MAQSEPAAGQWEDDAKTAPGSSSAEGKLLQGQKRAGDPPPENAVHCILFEVGAGENFTFPFRGPFSFYSMHQGRIGRRSENCEKLAREKAQIRKVRSVA